ncbi:hypothetical protein E2C01_079070 [Portunus trituberculatus]|uniref:Uncharacterized protein n=1 Tax=Portunus trituberculatus TaxID=210409 RepID=A0A5B7IPM8_PORTR|nr:hypothetical protein [Portunus trituberculatus]
MDKRPQRSGTENARKRCWRVATREDGAFRRTVEEGTLRLSKERPPHGKNPGTVHKQVQQQGKPVSLSYAQPATRKPSPEHGGSERTVERRIDPDRHTEKRTHPVARLPDPEEEKHTGADDESVLWQTDLPEKTPTPGTLSCKFQDVGSTLNRHTPD